MDIEHLSPQEKRALLEKILRQKVQAGRPDLQAEARFDLEVDADAVDLDKEPQIIFLTGATGFVGAFVLRKLLDTTGARIYCLVRASDPEEAKKRVKANLKSYELETADLDSRLVPVPGDLTKPYLGLTAEQFRSLASVLDVIYHIGASVNLAHHYQQLKPTNVNGTKEIIKLAGSGRVKPLHYLSTYAVFDSIHNVGRVFSEDDEPTQSEGLSNGYSESKWVGEKMVRNCRAAGIPTCIYRVGWVVGHSRTGAWNSSDFIPRTIKAFLEVGKYCDLGRMTMTPVDYLADSLVYLSRRKESVGKIFHLSNGQQYESRQLFNWVESFGYKLQSVSLKEWEKEIRESSQEISLTPLLLFLEDVAGGMSSLSQWFSREPNVDVALTRKELTPGGIVCPDIDARMMALYLSYFISKGYLRPPAQGGREARTSG
jgi:thioester reductase-like protein